MLWTMVGNLPVDGDLQRFTLPMELALAGRLADIAWEDGYLNFDPDPAPSGVQGWADQVVGLNYPFLRDGVAGLAQAGSFLYEVPTGDSRVIHRGNGGKRSILISAGGCGFPLPEANENLMENRFRLDLVIRF